MASGNTSSAAPAEPVGNRMCVPLPAGISAVTFIFPLSGSAGAPAAVSGTYWPATFDRPGYFYSCAVTGSSAVVTPIVNVDLGYSVRCVRAREEQAIPCFFPLAGSSVARGSCAGTIGRLISYLMLGRFTCVWTVRPCAMTSLRTASSLAFVASVPGKSRRSLAFSRWPGRLRRRRVLAARIGPPLVPSQATALRSLCPLVVLPSPLPPPCRSLTAFVASVPGKNRQSLFFGIVGFWVL